jgi:fructose-1,6-bisphosphatase
MAELTANFNGKNITVTYPDSILGKAQEAFPAMNTGEWSSFYQDKLDALNEDEPTEDQLSEWKYAFTVGCIINIIKQTVKSYEIQKVIKNVEDQAKAVVNEALDQINVEIETESSGPEYV